MMIWMSAAAHPGMPRVGCGAVIGIGPSSVHVRDAG